ncbi:MAM and LDL-receptor class A domain-containing protein 1-like [Elgaria multicarinata webbii]|uniref:MAM and LDL-receptor class A domain-containing protein 1-like n=1 Tax=Elgaria multicarinata webbii TaxID=159646 RepID=UPI002FCCBFE4
MARMKQKPRAVSVHGRVPGHLAINTHTQATCGIESFSVCEFEQDWCDWEVEPNKTLSWARNSSLQVAPSHAWPTRDHSTNSPAGSFAYVTSVPSRGLQLGDAWLTSPMLKVNGSCQLVLYVHLYASNSNRLNIYYRTGTTMKLVRTRAGDLGDYWVREKVDFQVEQVDFQIVIEGLIGTGHQGNIALDDLVLSPGCLKQGRGLLVSHAPDPHMPCSQDQFACNNSKQCINVELVCDFKTDCADLSDEWNCGVTSFTSGTGGWTDISVGRLQWVLRNASSQPDSTVLVSEPGHLPLVRRTLEPKTVASKQWLWWFGTRAPTSAFWEMCVL